MSAPFRFGIHLWELPAEDWPERVRRYESLGFSTITFTDHLVVPQWEPLTAVAAVAAATQRIRVGTLVLDAGLRDPVLTAKAAATVERLSGGRLELGLGAGYVAANFAAAGMAFESGADRVARLEEMVTLITRLWAEPSTSFHGRFFDVVESPRVAPEPVRPRLLIGGGGRRVMGLGGAVADTVSMIARQTSGEWSIADSLPDSTENRMAEKAAWVRAGAEQAGRDPESVELNTMVPKVIVGDDPGPRIAAEATETGITPAQMADSTLYLCGTGPEVYDRLQRWRQAIGISYVSLFDPGEDQIEYFAEKVADRLIGQ
ncbi:MAG TPA: TIGR03621 family F420-dependent LLM class oxidoreductase [Acidimicrobiales bacterium]|nr:TIGR03621 family F420-dependent LLM class oxidoreductase [Acidimicrobiales bacterium]